MSAVHPLCNTENRRLFGTYGGKVRHCISIRRTWLKSCRSLRKFRW